MNEQELYQQYLKETGGGSSQPSDAELYKQYQAEKDQGPGMLESGLRGAAQGITGGFQDELEGALAGAGRAIGFEGFGGNITDIHLSPGGPTLDWDKISGAYTDARDKQRGVNADARASNPKTYGAGEIGGTIGQNMLIPGLNAAKGAGLAANVGKGAIQGAIAGSGHSDASDALGLAKDTSVGAGAGGVGGALSFGAEKAISKIPSLFSRAADSLNDRADKLYLKSTGATGKQLEKFAADAPQELRKYVRPFDSPEDIANKLTEAMEMSGSDVGSALHDLDQMGATVHTKDVVNKLRQRAAELGADPSQMNTASKLSIIADQIDSSIGVRRNLGGYTVPGQEAQINKVMDAGSYTVPGTKTQTHITMDPNTGMPVTRTVPGMDATTVPIKAPTRTTINPVTGMPESLPDIAGYGPTHVPIVENTRLRTNPITGMMEESTGPMPLSQSENVKRGFGAKIKNWLDPESGAANKEAYRAYMSAGEEAAQKTNSELAQHFESAKKAYGLLDPMLEAAQKRANTLNQSPFGGLGDTAAQAVGMLPGGNTVTGLASAAGRRILAPRLASSAAWSADKIADVVRATPEVFGKYAGVLQSAAQRGPQGLASTHFILESTDPAYREMIRSVADRDIGE